MKKRKKAKKRILIILGTIILLCITFCISPFGKKLFIHMAGNYIYGKLNVKEPAKDINTSNNKIQPQNIVENNDINKKNNSSNIEKNILLIGEEQFDGASNTDAMIVASLNTKDKTIKLTSLMRDLYVNIPGYRNNKLNSVFSKGGIELLYETIGNNFGINIDGYILVNFKSLEYIVNKLGGIKVTLTKNEADYLNAKNYISNKKYRNVVEGTQTMNGNQVMGYCRIRYVSTGTQNDDFGRTQRQRLVLKSIYQKLRKMNVLKLTWFMNDILSNQNIITDISRTEFNNYFEQLVDLIGHIKIKEYRVPADGTYENQKVLLGSKKAAVLVPNDWNAIRNDINNFIYNSKIEQDNASDN